MFCFSFEVQLHFLSSVFYSLDLDAINEAAELEEKEMMPAHRHKISRDHCKHQSDLLHEQTAEAKYPQPNNKKIITCAS